MSAPPTSRRTERRSKASLRVCKRSSRSSSGTRPVAAHGVWSLPCSFHHLASGRRPRQWLVLHQSLGRRWRCIFAAGERGGGEAGGLSRLGKGTGVASDKLRCLLKLLGVRILTRRGGRKSLHASRSSFDATPILSSWGWKVSPSITDRI